MKLKSSLMCGYNYDVPPTPSGSEKSPIKVGIAVLPKMIRFEDSTNTLSLHCWTALNWTDPQLKWKPEEHAGIESLRIKSYNIWSPDIFVHNAGDADDADPLYLDSLCAVGSDGQIICVPATVYKTHCEANFINFPYDVQDCTIELASWAYSADELVFTLAPEISTSDLSEDGIWEVLKIKQEIELRDYRLNETIDAHIYKIRILLLRRGAGVDAVFVVPGIMLMLMTLVTLWLDCRSTERTLVASISFVCHLLCIQQIFADIPRNGAVLPNLLSLYESSFMLAGASLVLTVLLRELSSPSNTSEAPTWLSSTTGLVLRSRVGQLLLLNGLDPKASAFLEHLADDNDGLVSTHDENEANTIGAVSAQHSQRKKDGNPTWAPACLLLAWTALAGAFLAYLILLALYLPSERSAEQAQLSETWI
ncbi:hypothetical protein QAD02_024420 [Eretmocerus hayati]|uniref:Uncharacterized protein n=1 Tax=Eretmocerus hayati TaxID=131215 RepID=A0ACC2PYZ5_9HYME|nr:hypothetical protein QAD02_024420 [Eretmocerus hayati]